MGGGARGGGAARGSSLQWARSLQLPAGSCGTAPPASPCQAVLVSAFRDFAAVALSCGLTASAVARSRANCMQTCKTSPQIDAGLQPLGAGRVHRQEGLPSGQAPPHQFVLCVTTRGAEAGAGHALQRGRMARSHWSRSMEIGDMAPSQALKRCGVHQVISKEHAGTSAASSGGLQVPALRPLHLSPWRQVAISLSKLASASEQPGRVFQLCSTVSTWALSRAKRPPCSGAHAVYKGLQSP